MPSKMPGRPGQRQNKNAKSMEIIANFLTFRHLFKKSIEMS